MLIMEMANCTEQLIQDIADPKMYRKNVAMTYALALKSSEETDWARVNKAIMVRYRMVQPLPVIDLRLNTA